MLVSNFELWISDFFESVVTESRTVISMVSSLGSLIGESGDLGQAVAALRRLHVEEVLLPVLVQLTVIILAARFFANVFRRLGQPWVVGEIAAGLILGPSCLGYFFPGVAEAIFHPHWHGPEVPHALFDATMHWIFTTLSQVGLVLLLFLVGLEFDFSHLREHGRAAINISLAGILLPFTLGAGVAALMHGAVESAREASLLNRILFMGTAMSITALPILGRMMMELNLTRTRVGAITISAAATDDAMGWTLLAAVSAIVAGGYQLAATLAMVGSTVGFALFMWLAAKPLLCRWARWTLAHGKGELTPDGLAFLIAVVLGCAIVTNLIGIFAIFGAFVAGAVLSGENELREAVNRRLRDIVTVFFLPIFFTYTGLRTEIGSLATGQLWLFCGLILAAAVLGKFGGCTLAARLSGFSFRESACIGAMMNTRALMELIVINVGYQLQVIPRSVFCMLVIMALATTAMTTPILLWLVRGTELEPRVRASDFLNPSRRREDATG